MTKAKRTAEWQKRNPEKVREHRRTYYQRHKEAEDLRRRLRNAKNRGRVNQLSRAWKNRNPEKVKASAFKTAYGVSIDVFFQLFEKQKGLCAICRENKATHTDHDHVTKKIRGLLCPSCNMAIGMMKDDVRRLQNAAKYLSK